MGAVEKTNGALQRRRTEVHVPLRGPQIGMPGQLLTVDSAPPTRITNSAAPIVTKSPSFILSELRKPRPSARVVSFIAAQPLESLFVSEVTFAEIRFGIERLSDPMRRSELHTWLDNALRPMFQRRVLATSEDVWFRWRLMVDAGSKSGHTFSEPDLIIGATALHNGLTVVTRDTAEYTRAGVPVLNPWKEGV